MAHVENGSAIRIGVCSDTHLWFGGTNVEGDTIQLQGHSETLFNALLSELKRAQLDLILHLGDVTCGGGAFNMPLQSFYETSARVAAELAALGPEAYSVPGNHDCPLGGDWSHHEKLWGLNNGEGKTIDLSHVRIVLLNAQGHTPQQLEEVAPEDPVYGWLSDAELNRLEESLATAGDRKVLLFVHQLILPWCLQEQSWKAFYGVLNRQEILALMERYGNVRGVFQGHAHRYDLQCKRVGAERCLFVVLPSLIEYPLGWLTLEIGDRVTGSLQTLPLPEIARINLESGSGQAWRRGLSEWQEFVIPLT